LTCAVDVKGAMGLLSSLPPFLEKAELSRAFMEEESAAVDLVWCMVVCQSVAAVRQHAKAVLSAVAPELAPALGRVLIKCHRRLLRAEISLAPCLEVRSVYVGYVAG